MKIHWSLSLNPTDIDPVTTFTIQETEIVNEDEDLF